MTRTNLTSLALVLGLAACSSAPPPKMVANKADDGVPANSASEERLSEGGKPKPSIDRAPAEDPTQPYTTPLNGGEGAGAGAGTGGAGAATTGKSGGKNGKPKEAPSKVGKVSKAECKQLFDKYIDLTFATDSRFEGVPPEMIAGLKAQALSQAQSQKSDPCATEEVTRPQYNCAIASTTTAGWQRCMK